MRNRNLLFLITLFLIAPVRLYADGLSGGIVLIGLAGVIITGIIIVLLIVFAIKMIKKIIKKKDAIDQ